MSYDVFVQKFRQSYVSMADIPDDEEPLALGEAADVRAAISAAFPNTDWSDPTWGIWDSELGSIEFNVGNEDVVGDIALHVRGGIEVMPGILQLLRGNGWQGMDGQDETFIENRPVPSEGLNAWKAYRDKATW